MNKANKKDMFQMHMSAISCQCFKCFLSQEKRLDHHKIIFLTSEISRMAYKVKMSYTNPHDESISRFIFFCNVSDNLQFVNNKCLIYMYKVC